MSGDDEVRLLSMYTGIDGFLDRLAGKPMVD